jgi:hypothetical protein
MSFTVQATLGWALSFNKLTPLRMLSFDSGMEISESSTEALYIVGDIMVL